MSSHSNKTFINSTTMAASYDNTDKLAQAIMAQARAQATPVKKNWGNPGPLFVTYSAHHRLGITLTGN